LVRIRPRRGPGRRRPLLRTVLRAVHGGGLGRRAEGTPAVTRRTIRMAAAPTRQEAMSTGQAATTARRAPTARRVVTRCLAAVVMTVATVTAGGGTAAAAAAPPGGTPCLPDSPARPTCISGALADGTPYEFVVPARWNGTVVVALDFAGSGLTEPLTARLLADGVARGGTSRAITGWDIRAAIDNQAEALARFEQA